MSRPTPRRPASSRGNTPRPRKIAGQTAAGHLEEPTEEPTEDTVGETAPEESPAEPVARKEHDVLADTEDPDASRPGVLARPRTTRVLIIALAVMALVLAAQAVWMLVGDDDDPPRATTDSARGVTVPDGRPVVASGVAVAEGVEAAAKAAQELVSVDYSKYDEEVARALALTTKRYEKDYLETISDVREQAVALKLVVQASVVGQGVVRANRTKLQALVFLNQVVSRERDGKPETVVTPFKVLVTMVHTDQGWLVDKLDTDEQQDKNN